MAETITAEEVNIYFEGPQVGTVIAYVLIQWSEEVILTGVPAITLEDGFGNTHNPLRAAPHITDLDKLRNTTRLRYQSVPRFGPFTITIPASVDGIEGAGGDTTAGATDPVVEQPPEPPPIPPVPPP